MSGDYRKILGLLFILLIMLLMIGYTWQCISVLTRLSRNEKIAKELARSLSEKFPESQFCGGASYEREVVYITVMKPLEENKYQDIEKWLEKRKIEQKILPQIWLKFAYDPDKKFIIK